MSGTAYIDLDDVDAVKAESRTEPTPSRHELAVCALSYLLAYYAHKDTPEGGPVREAIEALRAEVRP